MGCSKTVSFHFSAVFGTRLGQPRHTKLRAVRSMQMILRTRMHIQRTWCVIVHVWCIMTVEREKARTD